MTTIYGIPNCTTVKKARAWLAERELDADFYDFKKLGVSRALLDGWLEQVSLDLLINRKGTTWRALSDEEKARSATTEGALALLQAKPSLIKRPVLEANGHVLVGFDAGRYAEVLGQ